MGELYNDPNRECLGLAPAGAVDDGTEVDVIPMDDTEDE